MTTKKWGPVRFVRNGLPDGYMIRLSSLEEKYFPTVTRVVETADGGIDIYNERLHVKHFKKGQFSTYWPVQKER